MQQVNKREYKQLLLVGLDGAGKTTLVKRFKTISEGSYEYYTTTPYINVEKVTLPFNNIPCVVYDLSGQGRYRENWSFFYPDVDGIFFVVDSADKERLSIVQEILMEMAKHSVLREREIPVIVLANKQDLPGAVEDDDLKRIIQLDTLKTLCKLQFYVKATIAVTGQGISECFSLFEGTD